MLYFYSTPIGTIGIEEKNNKISSLYLKKSDLPKVMEIKETPLLQEAYRQIDLYLTGSLKLFSLPLAPKGTPFMQKVWECLKGIPYGSTLSYQQTAEIIGNPQAARAVGLACNRNPIPIFIPCHRIIGKNGSLTGYRGGLKLKRQLLSLELGRGWDFDG